MTDKQNEQKSNKPGAGKKPGHKKTSKQALDAASKFKDDAPTIGASAFFRGWEEDTYVNTYVIQEPTLQDRIAEYSVAAAETIARNELSQPAGNQDFEILVSATISLGLARKMLMTIPSSEQFEIGIFSDFLQVDHYLPSNSLAAIDHVGKFSKDDRVVRIRYHSQDTFRILLRTCRRLSHHSSFEGRFRPVIPDTDWQTLDIENIVINSESSALWLRDQSSKFLTAMFTTHFPVTILDEAGNGHQVEVSYPRLARSQNVRTQFNHFLTWVAVLDPNLPRAIRLALSGACTFWERFWFDHLDDHFQSLYPRRAMPAWFGQLTPRDLLDEFGIVYYNMDAERILGNGCKAMIQEAFAELSRERPVLSTFFNMVKQNRNEFGSEAQLIIYDQEDLVEKESRVFNDTTFMVPRGGAVVRNNRKVTDLGAVAAGLMFVYSNECFVVANFRAQASIDPNMARNQYLAGDVHIKNRR